MQDGPAGLRAVDEYVTAFPAGISVAATWDRKLMRARGVALGEEWRAKGSHVFLGPAADVTRAQEGGRAWESFGADAFLNGEAAYETIIGVQSQGVQACIKHLIGNNQEQYRFSMTSKIDRKTLRELYFKPFQRAIDAEVACVMCSYNKFNDKWACKNPELIGEDGLLRKEGGFQGYVVSDWGASHGIAVKSVKESVSAGLDVEMPGGYIFVGGGVYGNLKAAVEAKYVPESDVDKMATRFISAWFKVEQDKAYPPISFDAHDKSRQKKINVRSEAHTDLARKIAAASAVLLKNLNGALPLSPPGTLALIGLDAAPIPKKECGLNDHERQGTISVGWGSGSNCLQNVVAPAVAIQDMLTAQKASTKVQTSLTNDVDSAVAAAKSADVAILFVYTISGEIGAGFTSVEGNLGDRKNLNLLRNGEDLIKSVAAVNNQTIVVIHSVGSLVMETWVDLPGVKAIIMAGLPGEQTGPGIADVLFGKVNPSGRLPYTIAKNAADFGVDVYREGIFNGLKPVVDYKEGLLTDYRRFNQLNTTVRYCFGHGLSYTTFRYSQLKIEQGKDDVAYTVSFQVSNSGPRDGTEIAQLYLTFPSGLGEPPKQLRGFDSVFIPRGGTQTVSLALKTRDISVYETTANKWITPDRGFNVYVGSSLLEIHLEGSI
ncbi:family 3 glycoside hydrolase [Melampsora americana]|nr:family 3 glycoside hydrolase [Melampsora americana]